jgi:glutamate racemase
MSSALPQTESADLPTDFRGQGFRLGVFDSGLGGLSILKAVRHLLPEADLLYVADSGHAPYGEKTDEYVAQRSARITRFLLDQAADVIVVACNTATAAAVHELRARWPDLPVVGIEPGVKPAVHHSHNKRVGVLATPITLASAKYADLIRRHGQQAHIVPQPCPGLAREIERGDLDSPALRQLIAQFTGPLLAAQVDTVALGCTHYPLIEPLFRAALGPEVRIIDNSEAVARQVRHQAHEVMKKRQGAPRSTTGAVGLWSSGDPQHLHQMAWRWLGIDATTGALPPEA